MLLGPPGSQKDWCHFDADSRVVPTLFFPIEAAKSPGCYCGAAHPQSRDLGQGSSSQSLSFHNCKLRRGGETGSPKAFWSESPMIWAGIVVGVFDVPNCNLFCVSFPFSCLYFQPSVHRPSVYLPISLPTHVLSGPSGPGIILSSEVTEEIKPGSLVSRAHSPEWNMDIGRKVGKEM